MTEPADTEFEVMERGYIRDVILGYFREGLRRRLNPETGALFTEDEIAQATGVDSRWYRQAQAIDDLGQGDQRKALFLANQLRIDRATTAWLETYHGPTWTPEGRLGASAGSGPVRVSGTPGTMVIGSATVPDETAYWGRTGKGLRVQVFAGGEIDPSGSIVVTMVAMDPGADSNPELDEVIEWSSRAPGMDPVATVTEDWTGGFDAESDADWASRMLGNVRHKQGGGNDAMQRALARGASNACLEAFVYATAFGNGSFLVVPLQKRGLGNKSPSALLPSVALQQAITSTVVPPGSSENASPPRGIVLPPQLQPSNLDLRIALPFGSATGFEDAVPWPNISDGPPSTRCYISGFEDADTAYLIAPGVATLPGQAAGATLTGSAVPKMMFWNEATSSWKSLTGVTSITQSIILPTQFTLQFSAVPTGLVGGCVISPSIASDGIRGLISAAIVRYFDERGPGELFDLATHERGARCVRFPEQREAFPSRVGAEVATRIVEELGGATSDADLVHASRTAPDYPTELLDGPNKITLGNVGIYPL